MSMLPSVDSKTFFEVSIRTDVFRPQHQSRIGLSIDWKGVATRYLRLRNVLQSTNFILKARE